jgi:hypothetical protein
MATFKSLLKEEYQMSDRDLAIQELTIKNFKGMKFKSLPAEVSKWGELKVGTSTFQFDGIPSIDIREGRRGFQGISMSSTDIENKKQLSMFIKMLQELEDNYDKLEKHYNGVSEIYNKMK